jgi:hypothetical protein
MHQPIKDGLESYLAGETGLSDIFHEHLRSCHQCAEQVRTIEGQSRMLASLRAEREPQSGFYARVLERIEQQVPPSIWSVMLEPAFGRSIAVAGALLTLVLGTYLIATEPGEGLSRPAAMVETQDFAAQQQGTNQRDRDAVLVNLASFREN